MTRYFLIILSLLMSCNLFAQTDRSLVRKGNRQFNENQYNKAEVLYKKSLLKTPNMTQANYNLGNTYFKQKRYDKAIEQYQKVLANNKDKKIAAQTYHNLGNSYLEKYKTESDQQKKTQYIDNSIQAYKNALINNPTDKDTKYNLSYALALKKMLQQQQKQQKQQQKQNQEQKPKPEKKQELTKEEAEKLLQAIRAQENNVQERQNKKEEKKKVKIEKEW